MKKINYFMIVMFFMCICTCEAVHLSIPKDLTVSGAYVEIPIHVSQTENMIAGGFSIRLEYDDTVLLNPEVISEGTLTQGKPILTKTEFPDDQYGGKFGIGIIFNLGQLTDGILFKIRLQMSEGFIFSPLSFVDKKSNFHSSDMYKIETSISSPLVLYHSNESLNVTYSGDCNWDGQLDLKDVLAIMKKMAESSD
jgi:hypothetical protein